MEDKNFLFAKVPIPRHFTLQVPPIFSTTLAATLIVLM